MDDYQILMILLTIAGLLLAAYKAGKDDREGKTAIQLALYGGFVPWIWEQAPCSAHPSIAIIARRAAKVKRRVFI